ncbi:nitrate reductase molybdenum cofactor assembly chaperone [Streptomyces silaceus]|uniref:nitrate reductase molybdenum cofactor assembly chaperone n=1 Tax=Streptomyces silaceus TaxID=545123 RepID=UPI0007C789D6|nr:nitrate reductase molybdenum cofactor assembly chaperone [Streptomyces silaceus]
MTPEAVVRLVAGRLLQYPDERLYADLDLLDEAAGHPRLSEFVAHARVRRPLDLAAHYTDVFDTRNRRCLYLTWWSDGDTRNRGLSLVRVKQVYREHGLEFDSEELPDFLPVLLEFAAREEAAGTALLEEHRAGLELLRLAVTDVGSPYARVLEAVCGTLPGPSPKTRAEAKALARSGPPRETVGLEPFGPDVDLPWPTVPAAPAAASATSAARAAQERTPA